MGLKKVNELVLTIDAKDSLRGITIKGAYLQIDKDPDGTIIEHSEDHLKRGGGDIYLKHFYNL